ncbi:MAG: response regulator [bacterium]
MNQPAGRPKPAAPGKTTLPPMALPKTRRARVLVVDDEPDVVDSIKRALGQALPSVEVATATSGMQGLDILRRQAIDLIVTDFKMPRMNGLEFLDEAARVRPGTPSIMISAFPDPALVVQATRDFGVRLFIAKPFDLDYFAETLRGILF